MRVSSTPPAGESPTPPERAYTAPAPSAASTTSTVSSSAHELDEAGA